MGKNKHTPGPWTIGGKTGFINQLKIEPTICVVYGAGEELIANSSLIAAAPELLAALEDLTRILDQADVDYGVYSRRKARAAIAKAKAKQEGPAT